jgi:hypothetical protein
MRDKWDSIFLGLESRISFIHACGLTIKKYLGFARRARSRHYQRDTDQLRIGGLDPGLVAFNKYRPLRAGSPSETRRRSIKYN